jgi:hypothetical protein
MDPILEAESRRLVASTALTAHVVKILGGCVSAESGADELLALARRLREAGPVAERRLRVRFEPPFPGATAGVEEAPASPRLVLACTALGARRERLHVVFTTLIPGRRPLVSVAPVEARIPEDWRPLGGAAPP